MELKEKASLFLDRFYGRQDVYAVKSQAGMYYPVCVNFWTDRCHLKLKDGIRCSECEIKQWKSVTQQTAIDHINHEAQHMFYMLLPDSTIKFGAVDFDMKPGKEEKGYGWDDVARFVEEVKRTGVPHYIARSTTDGFHVYFFFGGFFPAYKFRGFIREMYHRCGFMEYMRTGVKPTPEFFPKQDYIEESSGLGNGIKPPMIEPQFEKERNGFVDDNNVFIGKGLPQKEVIAKQWEYLSKAETISEETFDAMCEREKIEIVAPVAPKSRPTSSHGAYGDFLSGGSHGQWKQPLRGSIEKILEGCAALRKLRDRTKAGEVLGHTEGFALYHVAMHVTDGIDWFHNNVTGWAENNQQLKQLEYSLRKNYNPVTCKYLQEQGVCEAGTKCFDKKPRIEMVDGKEVIRDDEPVDKWPEPSPIRYAFRKGEDFLKKLLDEATGLKNVADPGLKAEKLREIVDRVQVFDAKQQSEFKKAVRSLKLLAVSDVTAMFNEATKEYQKDFSEKISSRPDTVSENEIHYMKKDPYGYYHLKFGKDGAPKETPLCDFDIEIQEERVYQAEDTLTNAVYSGVVKARHMEKKFEIPIDKWAENRDFNAFFSRNLGNAYNVMRTNVDYIRHAAMAFSRAMGIEKTIYLVTQGYYKGTYLMPSALVSKDELAENTTNKVDLSMKEYAKNLDFILMDDQKLGEVLMHIKKDFLNCWPHKWTYTGLAHALLPVIVKPLKIAKKPTLFLEGLTGVGKTEMAQSLQCFWGKFDTLLNLSSTSKGVMDVAHDFNDALLVLDDFKGLDRYQIDSVGKIIQYTYDGTTSIKLRRDSTQVKPKGSRAILIASGEQFISNEASMVARCILLEVEKHDTSKTQEEYKAVDQYRDLYSGVTPAYMKWFLGLDHSEVRNQYHKIRFDLKKTFPNVQNGDRIAQNLALNYLSWFLFIKFLMFKNVITEDEAEELNIEHWGHMKFLNNNMVERCQEEQNGLVFVGTLRSMLSSKELRIDGVDAFDGETKAPVAGFVNEESKKNNSVFLYSDVVFQKVKSYHRDEPLRGTKRSILRQLSDMGVLLTHLGKTGRQIRHQNTRKWVIEVKAEALGIELVPDVPITTGHDVAMDDEGMF